MRIEENIKVEGGRSSGVSLQYRDKHRHSEQESRRGMMDNRHGWFERGDRILMGCEEESIRKGLVYRFEAGWHCRLRATKDLMRAAFNFKNFQF
jgi:hypothetical protein